MGYRALPHSLLSTSKDLNDEIRTSHPPPCQDRDVQKSLKLPEFLDFSHCLGLRCFCGKQQVWAPFFFWPLTRSEIIPVAIYGRWLIVPATGLQCLPLWLQMSTPSMWLG